MIDREEEEACALCRIDNVVLCTVRHITLAYLFFSQEDEMSLEIPGFVFTVWVAGKTKYMFQSDSAYL